MPKLQRLRSQAFDAQNGRCCYCGLPMWVTTPMELTARGLDGRAVLVLRCTAEHLRAQQNGGKTVAGNIAAACWLCNHRRHQRKDPPEPPRYCELVQARLARGKWHAPKLAAWIRRAAPAAGAS